MSTVLLCGGNVVHAGGIETANILVADGVITNIGPDASVDNADAVDCRERLLFPGLIDCHVHFREPGLTHKATMASEAASARSGGVTTVCEMPNTIPPTVTVAALTEKVRIAEKIADCDIRFFMGATEPQHLLALRDVWRGSSPSLQHLKSRCCGLKLFMDHSTGNQGADERTMEEAFMLCSQLKIPIVVHCEDAALNQSLWDRDIPVPQGLSPTAKHSLLRPPESEIIAIERAITLARKHRASLHIAHLSTGGGLTLVARAKNEGLPVTCEVAPHHLFLTVEDYASLGTLAKMNPPLRSAEDREALWRGIADGTVDCIATDHAPHTLEEKQCSDSLKAPSGVPGVETMLPLLLSVVAGKWPHPGQGLSIGDWRLAHEDILRLCFENPNRIFGLGKKGIVAGAEANIVVVDPNRAWTIEARHLHSKCSWTPYEGWSVSGRVEQIVGH